MTYQNISSSDLWENYELIDSGGFEKLERFGEWVLARPEPAATWSKSLSRAEWDRMASATFKSGMDVGRNSRLSGASISSQEQGEWQRTPQMPEKWWITYTYKEMKIRLRLGLTSFKHIGIFPEQAANWNFIYDSAKRIAQANASQPRILNLFAYTGGATLAARSAGAHVTHVDSIKQIVNWGRENMEGSGLDDIRWIVDDALKFVRREIKRGNIYDGIIMDPPAYGHGAGGEKWVLDSHLEELLECCRQILSPNNKFLLLNLYSLGYTPSVAKEIVDKVFGRYAPNRPATPPREQYGELYFNDRSGRALPMGVYCRALWV